MFVSLWLNPTPSPHSIRHTLRVQEYYEQDEARDLCRDLLDAVRYCHSLGVVNHLLAAEYILLTSQHDDTNVKLADFSMACSVSDGYLSEKCGVPNYVAPEIIRGEPHGTVCRLHTSMESPPFPVWRL